MSSPPGTTVWITDRKVAVEIVHRRPELRLRVGTGVHGVVEGPGEACVFELVIDGVVHRGWRYMTGNEVYVRLGGRTIVVTMTEADAAADGTARQRETRANMPGVVVAVHCDEGQVVRSGDRLVTIESMKLQTTLVAAHEAVVERVHVRPEAVFERGAVLVTFAKPTGP